jgi:4-diphosphocytidyl-2-C-methyl-D-erythritol kinase
MSSVFDSSKWYLSPAKINTFLQIVGRRDDGYHLLQTAFQLLDWGDYIRVSARDDDQIIRGNIEGYAQQVQSEHDLVIRAAHALREASNTKQGATIGFGGGSSNAATVLILLNALWNTGKTIDELAHIGLKLGADVPVFVRGRTAWAEGVGEQLTAIDASERWFLVVDSGESVPTAELFQSKELTRNASPVKIADFVSGLVRGNAFESLVRQRSPKIDSALTALSAFGDACLTGTGGGCFVSFTDQSEAKAAQAQLSGFRSWVVKGVNYSGLHQALGL